MSYQQPPQGPYGYVPPAPQHPRQAVTKPAWTLTQVCAVVFTCGLAYPLVWLYRRSKTTVTYYR